MDDIATQVAAIAIDGVVDALLGRARWRETLPRAMRVERETGVAGLVGTPSFAFAVNLTWADEFDEASSDLHVAQETRR